ncbi:MAG: hypothetical protein SOZ23_04155 [Methanosphaera sp.]|uniref:hypothetical protein n=1 Tax=Methanosphaera sp. TaxID=2666342 RepID=UPI0025CEE37C|nr:hypothetical protein [Methanosphaera sp.]MCI5866674.1 hypothetical protein [Methanosphaera sp.]MDD6535151.1 hypothetical protein [Methanosphaera sp.]MDY3955968.1 hypothetical protein [Methanosphaera sp.]
MKLNKIIAVLMVLLFSMTMMGMATATPVTTIEDGSDNPFILHHTDCNCKSMDKVEALKEHHLYHAAAEVACEKVKHDKNAKSSYGVHCPSCGSDNVGMRFALEGRSWKCYSCGYGWGSL